MNSVHISAQVYILCIRPRIYVQNARLHLCFLRIWVNTGICTCMCCVWMHMSMCCVCMHMSMCIRVFVLPSWCVYMCFAGACVLWLYECVRVPVHIRLHVLVVPGHF